MPNIILINDQDQEQTLTGVDKLVVRSEDGDVEFAQDISGNIIDRSISGAYSNDKITSIGSYAFMACTNLDSVDFPRVQSIGASAFLNCFGLNTVNFPSVTTIGNGAFNSCLYLQNAEFPRLQTVSEKAFYGNTNLKSITLERATTIKSQAFGSCGKLERVILSAQVVCALENQDAFSTTPIDGSFTSVTGYIYVPDDLVESYKTATNWSTYAAKIKPISELNT